MCIFRQVHVVPELLRSSVHFLMFIFMCVDVALSCICVSVYVFVSVSVSVCVCVCVLLRACFLCLVCVHVCS